MPPSTTGPKKEVLIVGTGAVGAFYGSRLQTSLSSVSVTCRSNYQSVSTSGLEMQTHSFGNYHFTPDLVFPSLPAAASADVEWDYIVVATKALPDVLDDSELIAPLLKTCPEATIVLIQNGVGVESPHRQRFPHNVVLSAVTVVSAQQTQPGVIKQNRWTRISIGPFVGDESNTALGKKSQERCKEFVELLKHGGIEDAEEYDERGLQLVRWHKLAINASMNPSSVLAGATGNARMSLDPELRLHLKGCMNEIFHTAPKVLGRDWPPKLKKVDADMILKSSERNTDGLPSMLVDWIEGRPMEIEVILGNPIRIAREKGIEMPRLQSLYALLKMAATRRAEEAKKAKL
ncbi:BZ3500_MvSof-1268-A1-R1_Chr1-3g02005 [Microbotryum saponariae]|uniref:2-dehydropantoate 2-reductase n=1 Tax=Microbotryum saponariae TaxID=289078 RepID=A0A2X0KB09_9BASI|nr:BZ3500_MvSof-1268-A1-R1_Chr1-3g02005 [Microbotryum saponariae]SCZ95150.1 BZ3501_MvSof-1269-A2-R1_Chr1-3g01607 [Microbotryum saponariae]